MNGNNPADRLPSLTSQIGDDYVDPYSAIRELLAPMFDFYVAPPYRADYLMNFTLYDYGPIKVSLAESGAAPCTMTRDLPLIARSGTDHFHVQLYRTHGFTMALNGTEKAVAAGDICLLDLSRAVTLQTGRIDSLSAIIDRQLLAPLLADVNSVHGMILSRDSEAGVAVREQLEDLWRQGATTTVAHGMERSRSTAAMLAAVIKAKGENRRETRAAFRESQFGAICRRIDRQIGDPSVDANLFIDEFHVTRATLYRMFKPHGGIGRYILGRRLNGVLRDLSNPKRLNEQIDTTLRRWGFANHTAAGRAFRHAYGMTPSECRARARDKGRGGGSGHAGAFDIPPEIPAHIARYQRSGLP